MRARIASRLNPLRIPHYRSTAPPPYLCRKRAPTSQIAPAVFWTALGQGPGKRKPRVSATDSRRAAPARARDARPKGRDPQPQPTATRSGASMAQTAWLLARQGSPVAKRCATTFTPIPHRTAPETASHVELRTVLLVYYSQTRLGAPRCSWLIPSAITGTSCRCRTG